MSPTPSITSAEVEILKLKLALAEEKLAHAATEANRQRAEYNIEFLVKDCGIRVSNLQGSHRKELEAEKATVKKLKEELAQYKRAFLNFQACAMTAETFLAERQEAEQGARVLARKLTVLGPLDDDETDSSYHDFHHPPYSLSLVRRALKGKKGWNVGKGEIGGSLLAADSPVIVESVPSGEPQKEE